MVSTPVGGLGLAAFSPSPGRRGLRSSPTGALGLDDDLGEDVILTTEGDVLLAAIYTEGEAPGPRAWAIWLCSSAILLGALLVLSILYRRGLLCGGGFRSRRSWRRRPSHAQPWRDWEREPRQSRLPSLFEVLHAAHSRDAFMHSPSSILGALPAPGPGGPGTRTNTASHAPSQTPQAQESSVAVAVPAATRRPPHAGRRDSPAVITDVAGFSASFSFSSSSSSSSTSPVAGRRSSGSALQSIPE